MHISRERRKSPPLLLSWAGLLGHRELIQVGSAAERQLCPGAALLHSTAGLGVWSAGDMRIEGKGERLKDVHAVSRLWAQWRSIAFSPWHGKFVSSGNAATFPGGINESGTSHRRVSACSFYVFVREIWAHLWESSIAPFSVCCCVHKLLMFFQPLLSQRTAPAEIIVIPCRHELCTLPLNRQISLTEILLHRSWS